MKLQAGAGNENWDTRYSTMTGWWYTYPSEKYESVGMMKFPIYGKIKAMFQTTNQIYIYIYRYTWACMCI